MSGNTNPNVVTDGLVLCLDAGNDESYANSGVIPPKSESIAGSWDDYGSNQANYTVVGDDGVIITGTSWVGEFTSQIPGGGGYFTVAFEYQSSSTATFLIDNDGSNNNIFNQSGIVATTTKQIFTKTANCTVGGAEDRMYINKTSGSGSVIITNYRFYKSDSSGNSLVWHDLGGSITGTLTNGPTFSSSNKGFIGFDGVNDIISCGDVISNLDDWTVEGFFKNNDASAGVFISNGYYNPGSGGWYVFMNTNYRLSPLFFDTSANYDVAYTSNNVITLDQWHHIVLTWDQSSFNNKVYVDTVEVLDWTSTRNSQHDNFCIGGRDPNYSQHTCAQSCASVKTYQRILTTAEILQNYNAHKARFGL